MTLTLEGLRAALTYPNVRAWLAALQLGEVAKQYRWTPDAYRQLYGGGLFDSLARHPNQKVTAGGYTSTAAGAYQALIGTWRDFCADVGEQDDLPFTAENQDLFAVWATRRRDALPDVIAGRIEAAVAKCGREWASLPGSPYGQPTVTMDAFRACYLTHGGTLDNAELLQPAAPIEDHSPVDLPPRPTEEWSMPIPAIVLGLIQAAASVLPVIATIRGDKTQASATQNLTIAGKVLDGISTAVGAVNHQQAVEMITLDPVAREKADAAIRAQYFDLMKFAQEQDGIAWERSEKSVSDARSFAEKMLGQEGWQSIGFGVLIGVLAILIIVGAGWMLWRLAELATTDQTTRGLIVGAAIAMLGQVVSYFFGSSSSSRQSGEALRNIAQGKGVQ